MQAIYIPRNIDDKNKTERNISIWNEWCFQFKFFRKWNTNINLYNCYKLYLSFCLCLAHSKLRIEFCVFLSLLRSIDVWGIWKRYWEEGGLLDCWITEEWKNVLALNVTFRFDGYMKNNFFPFFLPVTTTE